MVQGRLTLLSEGSSSIKEEDKKKMRIIFKIYIMIEC